MNNGFLPGIGFGLGAALCQSLFYLVARRFSHTWKSPLLLLALSHVTMGVMSVLVLLALPLKIFPPVSVYLIPLILAVLPYLAGQFCLFSALRRVESSRVAPLLGAKIIVLALMTSTLLQQHLKPLQWMAVLLSATATWFLNESGGRIPLPQLGLLGFAILGYSCSDFFIGVLMKHLAETGAWAPIIGTVLANGLCGVIMLPFVFQRDARSGRAWAQAAPCACTWFLAVFLLYACFASIGVVFGNIVQASRGLMSVVLGWIVMHIGHTHLEPHVTRRTFWRRMTGAALMLLAVVIYMYAQKPTTGS